MPVTLSTMLSVLKTDFTFLIEEFTGIFSREHYMPGDISK
jgi:hypothetical protein